MSHPFRSRAAPFGSLGIAGAALWYRFTLNRAPAASRWHKHFKPHRLAIRPAV